MKTIILENKTCVLKPVLLYCGVDFPFPKEFSKEPGYFYKSVILRMSIQASSQEQLNELIMISKFQNNETPIETVGFIPASFQEPTALFGSEIVIPFSKFILDNTSLLTYSLLPHSEVILKFYTLPL